MPGKVWDSAWGRGRGGLLGTLTVLPVQDGGAAETTPGRPCQWGPGWGRAGAAGAVQELSSWGWGVSGAAAGLWLSLSPGRGLPWKLEGGGGGGRGAPLFRLSRRHACGVRGNPRAWGTGGSAAVPGCDPTTPTPASAIPTAGRHTAPQPGTLQQQDAGPVATACDHAGCLGSGGGPFLWDLLPRSLGGGHF